jgi:hypothetical protein
MKLGCNRRGIHELATLAESELKGTGVVVCPPALTQYQLRRG